MPQYVRIKYVVDYNAFHIIYCSLILSYFSYCVELGGLTFKTIINPVFISWVINKAGYYDHPEPLSPSSHIKNFNDLVYFKTMQIMFNTKLKLFRIFLSTGA